MRRFKKVTAALLVTVMIVSMGISGNTVQASDSTSTEYTQLVLNQEASVTFDSESTETWFSFTPEADGYYYFKSSAQSWDIDPMATLYMKSDDENIYLAQNDDGGNYGDFSLGYDLAAGQTYYLSVYARQAGTFGIVVQESPFKSISFEPISIVEESMGYYAYQGTENEYYHYNNWVSNLLQYSVTMKDNVVVSGTGAFVEYNGERYQISITDTQSEEHWYVGNSYTTTASVGGCVAQVSITIDESPVQSISLAPIRIVENTNGNLYNQGTEYEYYGYSWTNKLNFTITMNDGQVITDIRANGFEHNGQWYPLYITTSDDQSSENPWLIGNTYTGNVHLMGCKTEVQISIIDTPISNIEVSPISIIENANGHLNNQGTDSEYFHYDWYQRLNYTITMEDGQVISGTNGNGFNYDGQYYWLGQFSSDSQSSDNPWKVGNTYTASLRVLGYTKEIQVSIIDTPIEKIDIEPISIMVGTNGNFEWSSSEDGYFRYYWWQKLNYTITMKDGDVITGTDGNGFDYDGQYYYLGNYASDSQNPDNAWEEGKTYTAKINVLGYSVEVPITIEESPIQSIEFKPIVIPENTNGYYNNQGTEEEWFYYNWSNLMEYTITMKDGEILTGRGTSVWDEDQYYWIGTNDKQWDQHWYAGNKYNVTANFFGKLATIEVSVLEKSETDGFEYMIQDNCAIIIGSDKEDTVLNIPSTIDGYTVIGITDLTYAMDYAEELTIPDTVTMLSSGLFDWNYTLKKITLGSGISNISNEMFIGAANLEDIQVSSENQNFCSIEGVVYDKEVTTLVVFPRGKEGTYTVPDTVKDIACLIDNIFTYNVKLDLGNSNTDYTVEDGVIYNKDKTVVYACDTEQTGKYVMPDTVTTINEGAFLNCSFSEVVVSENVSDIVYAAFAYSMELEKVVLPDNLKTISTAAFAECENLEEADLPETLESIGTEAFSKTAITSAVVPGGVAEVGFNAYKDSQLETLVLSEGIQEISYGAFRKTNLREVVLPNSLTELGAVVFADTPLETVTIGTGLEVISLFAFQNTNLTTVTLPENIAEVGDYAFAGSKLEEVIFQRDDIYIGYGAFRNCPIKEINLKESMIVAGQAFYGSAIEQIIIPQGVTDITYKSFAESKNLETIDIPDDLESIDGTAFDGTAWWEAQADGVVYLGNYLYGYKGVMPEDTEITVKEGTTLIAGYAFADELNLKTLNIPKSVKNIGDWALSGCFGLEKVTVDAENTNYSTNEDGTILYDSELNAVWKKVQSVEEIYIDDCYLSYGETLSAWVSDLMDIDYSAWKYAGVTYVDNSYEHVTFALTPEMVSGFDSTKIGWQTITIDLGKFTCETDIYIEAPSIESIVLEKLPNKTVYDLNQSFRTTGMVLKGICADGSEVQLYDYEVDGYDPTVVGKQTITVYCMEFETQFEVEVKEEKITYVDNSSTEEVKVEVSAPKEAIEEGATLVVEEKPLANVEDVEVPEIFEEENSVIFDIRFEKGEEEVQPTEEVTVSIPVPEGIDGRNCKVYHITDGEIKDMKASFVDGYLVFVTSHFSYYGLVQLPGVSVSGAITSVGEAAEEVVVKLFKGTEEYQTVTTTDGTYNFTNVLDGDYTILVSKENHVAREYTVTVGEEAVVQDMKTHLIGDIDGNGVVNVMDANQIILHARGVITLAGYAYKCANIDGNSIVNVMDANFATMHARGKLQLWQ